VSLESSTSNLVFSPSSLAASGTGFGTQNSQNSALQPLGYDDVPTMKAPYNPRGGGRAFVQRTGNPIKPCPEIPATAAQLCESL